MLKNRANNTVDCSRCAVHYLCLAKDLEPAVLAELNEIIASYKEVKKGEHIFHAQDPMNYLYAVYIGFCKDYVVDENGNERIDNFYLPGDIIGLESIPNRRHVFSAIAVEDSKLCVIPIDALFQLMQKHDSIMKRVININSYKMQNDQLMSVTTNANQRVADFLLNILYRYEERQKYEDHISLPMSQIDISNHLGMAHETVNRILRKFTKEKLIKIKSKKIYILSIERLKELTSPISFIGQL